MVPTLTPLQKKLLSLARDFFEDEISPESNFGSLVKKLNRQSIISNSSSPYFPEDEQLSRITHHRITRRAFVQMPYEASFILSNLANPKRISPEAAYAFSYLAPILPITTQVKLLANANKQTTSDTINELTKTKMKQQAEKAINEAHELLSYALTELNKALNG